MVVFLCVLVLAVAILFINLRLRVCICYDAIKNNGDILVEFFSVRVLKFDFKIELDKGIIISQKKKRKRRRRRIVFVGSIVPLLKLVDITEIRLKTHIGIIDDAFLSVMAFSSVRILLSAILSVFSNKTSSKVKALFTPSFTQNKADILACVKLRVRIISLIVGLFLIVLHNLKKRAILRKAKRRKA